MHATQLVRPQAAPCFSPDPSLCDRIARIAEQGPKAVDRRLVELNKEWTIGRWVKAICAMFLFAGLILTFTVSPWWLLLIGVSGVILAQYLFFPRSILGSLLAATGVRSGAVIEDERIALRVLRGDFKTLPTMHEIQDSDDAISRMVDEGGPAMDDDDEKIPSREAAMLITVGAATDRNE